MPSFDLNHLLSDNRDRLKRMVRIRMDNRLQGRVDESDVIQEAFAEAADRYQEYLDDASCSAFIWLRFLTLQKLAQFHRRHIRVQARSVKKEAALPNPGHSQVTSAILAREFVGNNTSPLSAVVRAERNQQVLDAIENLSETDREILSMRHYEQMSNQEAAEALGIETNTAYKRYVRALQHLRSFFPTTAPSDVQRPTNSSDESNQ